MATPGFKSAVFDAGSFRLDGRFRRNPLTLSLNTRLEGVSVPGEFIQADGSITLNISGSAVRNLSISAEGVFFR